MTAPALTVESLDAGYGEVAVLRGVTLTAAAGQITGTGVEALNVVLLAQQYV